MIGDKCPICNKGKVMKHAMDRGYYCTHGCILYGYFKREKQLRLIK